MKLCFCLRRFSSSSSSTLTRFVPRKTPKVQTQPTSTKALINTILTLLQSNRLQKAVSILFASPFPVPHSLYARLFQLCSSSLAIIEARKVESHLISFSPKPPTFLLNRAIETFSNCGCLADSKQLFDEMPHRDGGSWNAMIKAFAQCQEPENAVGLFRDMVREGVLANEVTFACVLGACGDVLEHCLVRQVHGLIWKYGFCGNVVLETSLVDVYGKCEYMREARRVFDEIEKPNEVTWNVIVRRYLEMGCGREAVIIFFKMFHTDVRPLSFTFSNALTACSSVRALREGMQIHGVAIKVNFDEDEVVSTSLTEMYGKCGKLESAQRVFDQCNSRDLVSWTSIVSAYAISGRMREARGLFNEMPGRNMVSWNVMLAGYSRSLQWEEALDFICLMLKTTEDIDHVTLGLMLNVCAGLSDIEMGKQVHGFIYRLGFSSNIFVGNALLNMYGKCGNLKNARVWFYQLSQSRDSISWNALLTGYAHHRMSEQAMTNFSEMKLETQPSEFTFATLLASCSNVFALDQGKQIHGFMIRNGYNLDIVIRGALVDMYSKCRCMLYALRVFDEAALRDVVLWNSIILGCCHNGRGNDAIRLFQSMKEERVKPDHITFQGLMLACLSEGCVDLARKYFNSMSNEYYIIPRLEHYECMIELFSRHGCMNELQNFVKEMQCDPTEAMLIRVFDACREHRCLKLGEWAAERLNELNPSVPFRFEIE